MNKLDKISLSARLMLRSTTFILLSLGTMPSHALAAGTVLITVVVLQSKSIEGPGRAKQVGQLPTRDVVRSAWQV